MNLNDLDLMKQQDPENMIGHINGLPEQLAAAWALGQRLALPAWAGIRQIVVAGMGGSAIGADLLAAYAEPQLQASLVTHRDYGLPAWVNADTLVVCSSHSGNTEETLAAYTAAKAAGSKILVVCTGGKLAALAQQDGHPLWQFEHKGQPRTAVGYSFGLLLALVARLGLLPDPGAELAGAVAAMQAQQAAFLPEVPDTQNPAKRMGGQLIGRWVTIYGAGLMAPVARRWKAQLNENSKAAASFEVIPETNHNALQGLMQPEAQFNASMALFLLAAQDDARNRKRTELTRNAVMVEGQNTDMIRAQGDTRMANLWTALHYGDYVSFYLAMGYGYDPTPVPALAAFKQAMAG
ncbi:MAG: bifunctional phosphoglucose/phosphomannose isomerase [Anaerolineales bacterium]|nr:bifunctional phosphoglucose/phosphomannose isomerase [Anaerolineales bacterium]MBX3004917.1 bifunctional phosphoglucose/phosphomannose isomerase [Anaerolineales bacterium]